MTRILMNTRNYQLKKVRQSNLENNPSHYQDDEPHYLEEFEDYW
jgi:hypothetical protein